MISKITPITKIKKITVQTKAFFSQYIHANPAFETPCTDVAMLRLYLSEPKLLLYDTHHVHNQKINLNL